MNELTAQAYVFFLAGFETSSTTMTLALYEIARHPDVQEKLRQEINEILDKHNDQLRYNGIVELTYTDNDQYEINHKKLTLILNERVLQKLSKNTHPFLSF
jgi:cytochrome P450 family 6